LRDGGLDIVVVAYKCQEDVDALLGSLPVMAKMPYELYFHDNSKNDQTLTILWNDLGRKGSGEYIAFLNTDIRISPGWDGRLAAFLGMHPEVGAAIPQPVGHDWPHLADPSQPILALTDTTPAPTPGAMAAIADKYAGAEGFGIFGECNAPFFAVMVRRTDWEILKGFDERFRFYGQDHDFQRRLRNRFGKTTVRVYCCPVWHRCAGCVKKAIGTVDFIAEMEQCGKIGGMIVSGRLPEWDALEDSEREAVRRDARYGRMPLALD
jgi:hypothetical protein